MPPTVLAGCPGPGGRSSRGRGPCAKCGRSAVAPSASPEVLGMPPAALPTVAVGALNKHSQGEERERNKKPVFSHSTQQGSLWLQHRELPFQLSQTFSLPRKYLQMIPQTTGTALSHQPHREPEVWESPLLLGRGGRRLEAGTRCSCGLQV